MWNSSRIRNFFVIPAVFLIFDSSTDTHTSWSITIVDDCGRFIQRYHEYIILLSIPRNFLIFIMHQWAWNSWKYPQTSRKCDEWAEVDGRKVKKFLILFPCFRLFILYYFFVFVYFPFYYFFVEKLTWGKRRFLMLHEEQKSDGRWRSEEIFYEVIIFRVVTRVKIRFKLELNSTPYA